MTNDRKRNPEYVDDLGPELLAIWTNHETIYPQPDPDDVAFLYDGMVPTWARHLTQAAGNRREQMALIQDVLEEIAKYPNLLRLPVDLDEFVPMPEAVRRFFPELAKTMPKRLEKHIQYAAKPEFIDYNFAKESEGNPGDPDAVCLKVRQQIAMNICNNFAFNSITQRRADNTNEYARSHGRIHLMYEILNGYGNVYADWPAYYRDFDKACEEEGVTKEVLATVTTTRDGLSQHIGGGVTNAILLPVFFNMVRRGWYYRFLNG